MVLNEERIKILEMVKEGKINPDEAALLLEALDTDQKPPTAKPPANQVPASKTTTISGPGKYLRILVTDTDTNKARVHVRIPLKLVKAGLKAGANFSPEIEGMDMETLMEFINAGEIGPIVDVVDEKDGEHVEISIE